MFLALSCFQASSSSRYGRYGRYGSRALHSSSRVRRYKFGGWQTSDDNVLEIKGIPLGEDEHEKLKLATETLVETNPELARALLMELADFKNKSVQNQRISLTSLDKVAGAKLQKREGRGKTALFSYLSEVDKTRILELTQAPGFEAVIKAKKGRTAFFANLPGEVKYFALKNWQQEREVSTDGPAAAEDGSAALNTRPPKAELLKLFASQGAPMIGFGFADNFLMIMFGETIDSRFGLYVSTMAAAGLGNLCSNIVGLSLADWIEHASERMGIPTPRLSLAQRETSLARGIAFLGTVTGVTLGCLLGMAPLCFFTDDKENGPDVRSAIE